MEPVRPLGRGHRGLLVKAGADGGSLVAGLAAGATLLGLAVAVWAYGVAAYRRSRPERSGPFSRQRAHAGLTAISIAAGLLAALIVLED